MKKIISITTILVVLSTVPVLAHGSHHGVKRTANYSICSTKSCTTTGLHNHNSKTYAAHYYGDGHKYHTYCEVEDCIADGYHSHNGMYSFGHKYNEYLS